MYGSSLIVVSSLFYGSYGVWSRLMGDSFGPYMQAAIRSVLVVLIVLPFALFGRQKWQPFRWRADKWWFLLSALASWLISAPLYFAYNRIGIGSATLSMYGGYLLSMFAFGWLFNREVYTKGKFLATVLAIAGLLLVFAPSAVGFLLFSFFAAFISGTAVGLDMAVSQRLRYSSSQTTIVAWGTGILVNIPMALILHEHTPGTLGHKGWLYLLCFTAASIAASWISIHGVKLIEAGAAGVLGLLEIVWALAFGLLFFHERPSVLAYLGAVCIVAAAAIPYINGFKKTKVKVIEEQPI